MKNFKLVGAGVAILVVLAFSAMSVASASATIVTLLAEWLVNGVAVAANLAAMATATELLLEDTKAVLGLKADVLCSGTLLGTVGVSGADTVTELLNLEGVAISLTALTGTSLACVNGENCAKPKVWAVHLPWQSLLELVEETGSSPFTGFADLLLSGTGGEVGWYVECPETPLGALDDECVTPNGAAEAANEAGGVDQTFSDAFTTLVEDKLALCSLSKEETGVVEGLGTQTTTEAGTTLQVSSVG